MDDTYAEIGTEVILCKHKRRISPIGFSWCDGCMDPLIGMKTKITEVFQRSGVLVCLVENGTHHYWRVEDMILASDVPLLTPKQKQQLNIKE